MLFTQRWTRCLVVSASLATPMTHAPGDDTPQTLSFQGVRGTAVENRGTTAVETSIAPRAAPAAQRRPSAEQMRRMRDATQMARRLAEFGDDAFRRGLMPLGDYLEQLSLAQEVELRAAEMVPGGSVTAVRQQQVQRLEQVVGHLRRFRAAAGPLGRMEASRSAVYEAHGLSNATSPGTWSDAGQLERTQRHAAIPVSIPHPATMGWSSDLQQAEWELANARLKLAEAREDDGGRDAAATQRAQAAGGYNVGRHYDADLGWAEFTQTSQATDTAAESAGATSRSEAQTSLRAELNAVAREAEVRSLHGRTGSVSSRLVNDQQPATGRPRADRVAMGVASVDALQGQLPAASRIALAAGAKHSPELSQDNVGMGRADRVAMAQLDLDLVDLQQAVQREDGPRVAELSASASRRAGNLFATQSEFYRQGTASLYELAKTWRTWRVIDRSGITIDEIVVPDAAPRTRALGQLTAVADETADLRGRNLADVTVVRLLSEVHSLDALESPQVTDPQYLQ